MLFSVLSFVAGIIVVQQFPVLPENFWVLGFICLVPFLAVLNYWRLMFFIIGLLWAVAFAHNRLVDRLPDHLEGKHILVEGTIIGLPQYDERRVRFDFAVSKSNKHLPKTLRLSWFFPKASIKSGQQWRLTVKLKKPHGRFNPGGFDYERWLFVQNIGATGYVRNSPPPEKLADSALWRGVDVLRQLIADDLTSLLKNSGYTGVIKALTVGERSGITDEQWDVFRKTGVVHLLAISGLHIGLISGLVYFLVLKISANCLIQAPQKIAALSAMLIALFYSALAGFSLPTQRSLLMLMVVMTAIIWQRNITVIHVLAIAMLVVLVIDPLAVLSAGFWLSFLAVGIIVYSLGAKLGKSESWINAIKIHWVTALGLAPFLLFYFQQFSVIAPVANFIAVPVISLLIVPLCFITVLIMGISPILAENILWFIDKILQVLWVILFEMAELPYATISTIKPPVYMLPFAVVGVLWLLAPKGVPARWVGLVLLLPLFFNRHDKPRQGALEMTLLDVGQGLSTVIETANHTLVFDTGAKYSEKYDMGDAVVIPFLKTRGVDDIDVLMISHGDNDHIGGAASIIEQSRVQSIMTSVPGLLKQYNPIRCESGQSWVWDQVYFEILSPEKDTLMGDNNNSCVLKVKTRQGSILLTGDIEAVAEHWLVENKANKLASDILISPHHGSKTSSSILFLSHVKPRIVLIASGYKNRFSFPHQEVLMRYDKINAIWMNTADDGAIVIKMRSGIKTVRRLRVEHSKYWN